MQCDGWQAQWKDGCAGSSEVRVNLCFVRLSCVRATVLCEIQCPSGQDFFLLQWQMVDA